jgi:hypothetical protein
MVSCHRYFQCIDFRYLDQRAIALQTFNITPRSIMEKQLTRAHVLLGTIVSTRCLRDIKSACKGHSFKEAIARLHKLESWERMANLACLGLNSTVRTNLTSINLHLARLYWITDGKHPREALTRARIHYERAMALSEYYRDLNLCIVTEYQNFSRYESWIAWNTVEALEATLQRNKRS